jgi:hypothetical protein
MALVGEIDVAAIEDRPFRFGGELEDGGKKLLAVRCALEGGAQTTGLAGEVVKIVRVKQIDVERLAASGGDLRRAGGQRGEIGEAVGVGKLAEDGVEVGWRRLLRVFRSAFLLPVAAAAAMTALMAAGVAVTAAAVLAAAVAFAAFVALPEWLVGVVVATARVRLIAAAWLLSTVLWWSWGGIACFSARCLRRVRARAGRVRSRGAVAGAVSGRVRGGG